MALDFNAVLTCEGMRCRERHNERLVDGLIVSIPNQTQPGFS